MRTQWRFRDGYGKLVGRRELNEISELREAPQSGIPQVRFNPSPQRRRVCHAKRVTPKQVVQNTSREGRFFVRRHECPAGGCNLNGAVAEVNISHHPNFPQPASDEHHLSAMKIERDGRCDRKATLGGVNK